jgi:hypothetical protein
LLRFCSSPEPETNSGMHCFSERMTTLLWLGRHEGTWLFLGRGKWNAFCSCLTAGSYCKSADKVSVLRRAIWGPILGRIPCPLRDRAEFLPAAEGLILNKCLVQNCCHRIWNPSQGVFKDQSAFGWRAKNCRP